MHQQREKQRQQQHQQQRSTAAADEPLKFDDAAMQERERAHAG